ncbi:hypothetical protein V6C27_07865 [Peptococcaceae bacterium 1198_IL3148]
MARAGFKNRKKVKMLLYIDYNTQVFEDFIIGPVNNRVKIFKRNDLYFIDRMDGTAPTGYNRIKHLVNDMDNDILDHLDKLIF